MIEINKDSESNKNSPYQEDIAYEQYFPCISRAKVLSQMKEAVQDGVTLMVLTGGDGSGKTMLCRMLEHEALCKTVFFPHPVDSFDEVLLTIAINLALVQDIETDNVDQSLQRIIDYLLDESIELLIIFDEAENIFLATLTRIGKMLDRIKAAGAQVHILLSGRETLLENCDQVSLGNLGNTDERQFELLPLSEAETADYLQKVALRLPDLDAAELFTDEVVSKIYDLAQGNFRMTSILGQEAIQPDNDDTSFMVLLEGVEEGGDAEGDSPVIKYPQLVGKLTRYLPWIGAAACCLLLLLFLFRSGGDKSEEDKEVTDTPKAEQMATVATSQETGDKLVEKKETATLAPVEEQQPPEEEEAVSGLEPPPPDEEAATVPQAIVKSPQPAVNLKQDVVEKVEPEAGEEAETVAVATSDDSAPVAGTEEKELVEAVQESPSPETVPTEIQDIARLRAGKQVKRKAELSARPQPPQSAGLKIVVSPPSAADRLFNARLSAGSGWESQEKKKMYTVQLMALSSKNGEKNLKNMLAQVKYRQEAGNFYIFRKKTGPEGIVVFYGEYPSIDMARLAQKSLPQFLRDYKPYALSISQAVNKVGR